MREGRKAMRRQELRYRQNRPIIRGDRKVIRGDRKVIMGKLEIDAPAQVVGRSPEYARKAPPQRSYTRGRVSDERGPEGHEPAGLRLVETPARCECRRVIRGWVL